MLDDLYRAVITGLTDILVLGMEVLGDPTTSGSIFTTSAATGREVALALLEREAFYERARTTYAVVATGERQPYEDFILMNGVIAEDRSGG